MGIPEASCSAYVTGTDPFSSIYRLLNAKMPVSPQFCPPRRIPPPFPVCLHSAPICGIGQEEVDRISHLLLGRFFLHCTLSTIPTVSVFEILHPIKYTETNILHPLWTSEPSAQKKSKFDLPTKNKFLHLAHFFKKWHLACLSGGCDIPLNWT